MQGALIHVVECVNCHATAPVPDGQHIHDALVCTCCPDHDHTHTDQGIACRPVIVHGYASVVPITQIPGTPPTHPGDQPPPPPVVGTPWPTGG